MSLMKRISLIFRSKANKALDRAEDPRETLDYSYQRQLDLLSKVRRGVADVATSRKRVELQVAQLEQSAAKLQAQAEKSLTMNREDLAREALTRKSALATPDHRPQGPVRPAPGRGGEAHPRPAAAAGEGGGVPHPQGDDQGDLHRRRGADPHQRGDVGDRRGDGRRRPGHPAGRGQDRADAGPRRGHRRADRLRRARRRQRDQQRRRHHPRARVDELAGRRRGRAGPAQVALRPGPAGGHRGRARAGRDPRRRTGEAGDGSDPSPNASKDA